MKERIVRFINQISSQISSVFGEVGAWLLSILAIVLIVDFSSRGVGKPVSDLSVIAVFVLIAAVYLGMPLCEERKGHVRVESLVGRLPPKVRRVGNLCAYCFALLTLTTVGYAVGQYLLYSWRTKESVAGIGIWPLYPVIFVILASLVVYWLRLLFNTVEEFKGSSLRAWHRPGRTRRGEETGF